MKYYVYALTLLCFLIPVTAGAQSDGSDCSVDNIEACTVDLSVFCQKQGEVPFKFFINDDFDIEFQATFPEAFAGNRLPLFFVDGEVESGNVNETKVTSLKCKNKVCSGVITVEKATELESTFDFDQAFITIVLRKLNRFGKAFCIGKFTNDPELVADNDASVRQICTLTPTAGNEGVSGTGFFNPGGFGSDGEARFHLTLEGLSTDTEFKACSIIGTNDYKKAFTVQAVDLATADDDAIYGTLSPREQDEFNANRFLYSYELRRSVLEAAEAEGFSNRLTPSLSLINKSVSSSSSSNTVRESNKATLKKRRRARRRKQKSKSKRSLTLTSVRADESSADQQEVLSYLNFDPLGGTVLISTTCARNVQENAVGTLVCGNDAEDDFRRCRFFTFNEEENQSASTCREFKDGVGELNVRVRGFELGTYSICVDGEVISNALVVTQDDSFDFTFGDLQLTNSESLAAGDSDFDLIDDSVDISTISTVAITASGDCNDTLGGTVTF